MGDKVSCALGGFPDGGFEVRELQPIKVLADLGSIHNIKVETRHTYKRQASQKVAPAFEKPRQTFTQVTLVA